MNYTALAIAIFVLGCVVVPLAVMFSRWMERRRAARRARFWANMANHPAHRAITARYSR